MSTKVMKPSEVDLKKIEVSKLKKMSSGAKISYVNYGSLDEEGVVSLQIQSPHMAMTFDAKYYPDEQGGKYDCRVSLNGETGDMLAFIEMMRNMDELIKGIAKKNSKEWFGKASISDEILNEKYISIVRDYKDPETGEKTGKYSPTFGFKVKHNKEKQYLCKFFDENKSKININDESGDNFKSVEGILKKGTSMRMILKCTGLWFSPQGFGCSWKPLQMKVRVPIMMDEYAFDSSEDEDDEDEDDAGSELAIESSDDDDESEEEEIVVKKKKRGKK